MTNPEDGTYNGLNRNARRSTVRLAEILDADGQLISTGLAEFPPAGLIWTYYPDTPAGMPDKILAKGGTLFLSPDVKVSVGRPRRCVACGGVPPHFHFEGSDCS